MAADVVECAHSSYGKEIESCSYDMLISHDINVSVEFLMAGYYYYSLTMTMYI